MPLPDLTTARALAASLMGDTCTIRRDPAGAVDAVLDRDTGVLTDDAPVVVYSGPCLVRKGDENADTVAGQPVGLARLRVRLPWTAPTPQVADLVSIDTAADPDLVGATGSVGRVAVGGLVDRKLDVVETRAGGEVPGG